jgi:D-alanine-D-alanine ligase-like ATP-grasp enzyme
MISSANIKRIYPGPNFLSKTPILLVDLIFSSNESPSVNTGHHLIPELMDKIQPPHTKEWQSDLPTLSAFGLQSTPAETIAYLCVLLQRWIGFPASEYFSITATSDKDGIFHHDIAFEYFQINSAGLAVETAINLVSEFIQKQATVETIQKNAALQNFLKVYVSKPPSHVGFIREAVKRGIPWKSLGETEAFVEFGQGLNRRRVFKKFSGNTSTISTQISTNKSVANNILRSNGLPVPLQRVVTTEPAAINAFHALKPPLVVKPLTTDFGVAVYPGLETEQEVIEAFRAARKYGQVLIETHIPGDHHRIMVINGKFVSARKQLPALVIGNGIHTVRELVNTTNDIRLKNGWNPIPLDVESESLLVRKNLSWDSIPPMGQRVNLRLQGNLSTGGSMEVVTNAIHPENILMARRAAMVMDIDIAGIDFITTDITRPFHETGGQICEINVTPGFIFNEQRILFDDWFPSGNAGRIPIVAILDPAEDGHLGLCIRDALKKFLNKPVSLASEKGVFLDQDLICHEKVSMNSRTQMAISEPGVAAAVLSFDSLEILRNGIAVDQIDILFIVDNKPKDTSRFNERQKAIAILSNILNNDYQYTTDTSLTTDTSPGESTDNIDASSEEHAECQICGEAISKEDASHIDKFSKWLQLLER